VPYRLTAEPAVWAWLDDHPDLAPGVEVWLFEVAGDPRRFVEVQFPAVVGPAEASPGGEGASEGLGTMPFGEEVEQ